MRRPFWLQAMTHSLKWDNTVGTVSRGVVTAIGVLAMKLARKCFRWSLGRCSWCGRDCGMSSTISIRGKRCQSLDSNCSELPW
jgi:hypothetical protein